MKQKKSIIPLIFFVLTLIMILSIGTYAWFQHSTWVYDAMMLLVIWVIFLVVHKHIQMKPYTYALGFISIFLHDAGTFGWYATMPLGIRYDHITHFFVSLTLAAIFFNYFDLYLADKKNKLIAVMLATLLTVMGLGACIEMTEFAGAKMFGEGDGMFLWGVGDGAEFGTDTPMEWTNTMLDLIFNFLGALAGVCMILLRRGISSFSSRRS